MAKVGRKYLKIIGFLLVILSLIFIGRLLMKMELDRVIDRLSGELFLLLLGGAFLYMIPLTLLALNWCTLLGIFSNIKVRLKVAMPLYLKTSIAKYLPSNLMHFAGRHLLTKEGHSNSSLLAANMGELIMLLTTAFGVVACAYLAGVLTIPEEIIKLAARYRYLFIGLALAGLVVAAFLFWKLGLKKLAAHIKSRFNPVTLLKIMAAVVYYLCFFLLTGTILQLLLLTVGEVGFSGPKLLYTLASFALCWAAGFVIPGAPGGLGVREMAMLLLLSPVYGEESVLVASIALRLVTIGGDLLVFLAGLLFDRFRGGAKAATMKNSSIYIKN